MDDKIPTAMTRVKRLVVKTWELSGPELADDDGMECATPEMEIPQAAAPDVEDR